MLLFVFLSLLLYILAGGGAALVFSSLIFLYCFLPLNLLLYFLCKNKHYQNIILVLFSLAFYAWGEPRWIVLLIFSALVIMWDSQIIERNGYLESTLALVISIVINLSLLGFFKYSGFLAENLNAVLGVRIPSSNFSLPIGISFYTFQTLSYTIDVYRNETKAQPSFLKFLVFVSLFHQLVAGPIVRYSDIAYEIDNRTTNLSNISAGINRFVTGLAKKVLIANTAGELAGPLLDGNMDMLTTGGAWIGIILFSLQIYFDFSGYSDMAIGLGQMIGFHYKENFNYPYIARSATEFWRRWHISLGSFFRDYVYIPLGGNRKHQIRNLLIVWFLTGLWHGASWNFVLWGLFYGVLIILEKLFLEKWMKKLPAFVSHAWLLFAVIIGWVFFYYTDLNDAFRYLGIMFGAGRNGFLSFEDKILLSNNLLFFVVAIVCCTPLISKVWERIQKRIEGWKYSGWIPALGYPMANIVLLFLSTAFLVGKSYNPFLYFRF